MDWLRGLLISALALGAAPAWAEWQTSLIAQGGVRFAAATDPGGTLTIRCAAPDPEAAQPGQAGTAFNAVIEVSGSLFAPGASGDRMTATLTTDAAGYRFPVSVFDAQREVWPLPVAMADPAMLATLSAESLVFDNGFGQAWRYSTDGLSSAVRATFETCIAGWQSQGRRVPSQLAALAPARNAAPATQSSVGGIPAALAQHISTGCGGPYQLDPGELLTGLIDADDRPDYVLHWNAVRCTTGMARPFCGAANCSIDTYLSSRGYRHSARDSLLGTSVGLVPLSNGRMGVGISGTYSVCGTGFCDRPFWWDGTRLRQ